MEYNSKFFVSLVLIVQQLQPHPATASVFFAVDAGARPKEHFVIHYHVPPSPYLSQNDFKTASVSISNNLHNFHQQSSAVRINVSEPEIANATVSGSMPKGFLSASKIIAQKRPDIHKLRHGTPVQMFYSHPESFTSLVKSIQVSGYAHNEDMFWIAVMKPEGLHEFLQSHKEYVTMAAHGRQGNLLGLKNTILVQVQLVDTDAPRPTWGIYCHLCDDDSKFVFQSIPAVTPLTSAAYARLQAAVRIWNGHGHGKPALLESSMFMIPGQMPRCWVWSGEPYREYFDCDDYFILLWIIAQRLNFTLVLGDVDDLPGGVGLQVSTDFYAGDTLPFRGIHYYINDNREIGAVYCQYSMGLITPKWDFLLQPFDVWIWVGILATALAFGLVAKSVRRGLDIFWMLIGQSNQGELGMGFGALTLLLIVLTNGYLGVITSTVIAPLRPDTFYYMQDLVAAGYRLAYNDEDTEDRFKVGYVDPVFSQWNISADDVCCIIEPTARIGYAEPSFMAARKGFVPRIRDTENDARVLGQKLLPKDLAISCHMLEERLTKRLRISWSFGGHMAQRAFQLMAGGLTESGLTQLWYGYSLSHRSRNDTLFVTNSATDKDAPIQLQLLGSHLEIIFGLWLIAVGASCIVFLCEFGLHLSIRLGTHIAGRIINRRSRARVIHIEAT